MREVRYDAGERSFRGDPPWGSGARCAGARFGEELSRQGRWRPALDGVDLDIPTGTVLGLLGPNGAGKTTTVRVLTTLLKPDCGSAHVAGVDVVADPQGVRRKIGLSGQYAAVDENLTGFENLRMVGRLYGLSASDSTARARELLGDFRLDDAAERAAKTYSGGMRRRLDLAGALVARPPVVVLDERTTGLDPRGRLDMWGVIGKLVADDTTVLLTTQSLEEADQLAHSIAVIDSGKVIATGTADELKKQVGGEHWRSRSASRQTLPAPRPCWLGWAPQSRAWTARPAGSGSR